MIGRPTTKSGMQDLAKQTRNGPDRADVGGGAPGAGIYDNTAAGDSTADGSDRGKYRKNPHPARQGFWENFYFRPGKTRATPSSRPRSASRCLHLAPTANVPEGARALA